MGSTQDGAEFAGEFRLQVVDVVEADEFDAGHHRIEGLAVLVFPGGGDGAHGAAVEAVFEREELCAEGACPVRASSFAQARASLSAASLASVPLLAEEGPIHAGGFGEAQREGGLALVVRRGWRCG